MARSGQEKQKGHSQTAPTVASVMGQAPPSPQGEQVSIRIFSKRRIAIVGATVAIALAGGGAAFAYFTSAGIGDASASVGRAPVTGWSVTAPSNITGDLFPGSGSEVISFTVTNTDTGNEALSTLTPYVARNVAGYVFSGGTAVTGCDAAWFTATAGTPTPVLGTNLPHGSSYTVPVTVTMKESGTDQDACEGVDPEIVLRVS
jgi:hypothetical protein